MANKLIDWLLKEDILELKDGLAPQQVEVESETIVFDDLEPIDDAPQPGTIAAASKKKSATSAKKTKFVPIAIALGLVAALAAAGLYALPFDLLGPLTPLARSIRGDVAKSLPPAELAVIPDPAAPAPATDTAFAAIATATADVTETVSAVTAAADPVTSEASDSITSATPAPAPTQSKAATEVIAPPELMFLIVSGPLTSSRIPENIADKGFPLTITFGQTRQTGREVVSLQAVPDESIEKLRSALAAKNYKLTLMESATGKTIKVGPFIDRTHADDAAVILVMNQVMAKAQDVPITIKTPYLEAGPFSGEFAAEQARAEIAAELKLPTWRRDAKR